MRPLVADDAPADVNRASLAPIWIALSYVPVLVAKLFIAGTITLQWGGRVSAVGLLLAVVEAAAIAGAAHTAFTRRAAVRWWTVGAAIGAGVIFGAGAIYVLTSTNRFVTTGILAPLGNLVASTGVAAWLHRRAA